MGLTKPTKPDQVSLTLDLTWLDSNQVKKAKPSQASAWLDLIGALELLGWKVDGTPKVKRILLCLPESAAHDRRISFL